ncbi:MAG: hypothetical protein R3C49_19575 [Planctomycetaceae bacterium]
MNVNDLDESPFNFTLQGTVVPGVQIVDNSSAAYTTTGSWTTVDRNGYQGGFDITSPGDGSSTARFAFNVTAGETYRVSAAWRAYSNRATNASYTINDGVNPMTSVSVNQQLPPNPDQVEGTGLFDVFQDLGTFTISGGQLIVELSNNANGYVVADAIRIERL